MLYGLIVESSDYEFKEQLETKKPKSWLKTISSFANTIGGTMFFGVDDNRKIIGVDNPQYVND